MKKDNEENNNNPFFFFLRRTKKSFDFKKEITPNIHYLKLPKIKRKQIEEMKKKYKEIIKNKNKQMRENNLSSSVYSSNSYINGMKKNEWYHVIQQYNLLKPYYLKKKKLIYENDDFFKYDEFSNNKIHHKRLSYDFNININGINKIKSMPDIIKQLNNINDKIKIDIALGLGKIEESDPTPFNYFKLEKLFNLDNYSIIGFLDGKGKKNYIFCKIFIEEIKKYFLKENIYLTAINYIKKKNNFKITSDMIFDSLTKNNFNLIKKAFNKIPSYINEKGIDIDESGCIISLLFIIKEYIISVQIGNINPYFIFKKEQNTIEKFIIKRFNEEHNINNIYEIDRIEENRGNIKMFKNENGIKNERFVIDDNLNDIIIDFSRIFCYKKLNNFGIISQPDIKIMKYLFDENNSERGNENEDFDLINKEKYGDLYYIIVGTEYFFDYFKIQYYVKEINDLIRENKSVYEIAKEISKISKDNALFHIKDFKQRAVGLILFK